MKFSDSVELDCHAFALSYDILHRQACRGSGYAVLLFLDRVKDDLKEKLASPEWNRLDVLKLDYNTKKDSLLQDKQWQKVKNTALFSELVTLAETTKDPVVAARAARILLYFEILHERIQDDVEEQRKHDFSLILKYCKQLELYYTHTNKDKLVSEVQLCSIWAMQKSHALDSVMKEDSEADLYIDIFNTIKTNKIDDADKLIDKLEISHLWKSERYALSGSCCAHKNESNYKFLINFEQARQLQSQTSENDLMWIKYVTPYAKQYVWDIAQKIMVDKNEFTQGDFDVLACASLLNSNEKTVEERRALVKNGKEKHAHCSLLYAFTLYKDQGIALPQVQDWHTRAQVYSLLRHAALQGQRSLEGAKTLDYATQKKSLTILDDAFKQADLGSAIILGSFSAKAHDAILYILRCPLKIAVGDSSFLDTSIKRRLLS